MPGLQYGVCPCRLWTPGTLSAARLRHASHSATNCQHYPSGYPPYTRTGARVAYVFGAFDSANFGDQVMMPGVGLVPRNVPLIC